MVIRVLDCRYLPAGQVESLAHLLASIHLQLRNRKEATPTNTAYQYFVERYRDISKSKHLWRML